MPTDYDKYIAQITKAGEESRLSNLSRRDQITQIYNSIIKRYESGGSFGRGYESLIEARKVKDVSRSESRDIDLGFFGLRNRGQEFESAVGEPARLKLEDIRMERLSGAQTGLAGFLERINEPGPDYSLLAQLSSTQGQASVPSGGGSSYGGYKPLPTLAGRGGGPSYAPGKSPIQQSLAARNLAARDVQAQRSAAVGTPPDSKEVAPTGTTPYSQLATQTDTGASQMQIPQRTLQVYQSAVAQAKATGNYKGREDYYRKQYLGQFSSQVP